MSALTTTVSPTVRLIGKRPRRLGDAITRSTIDAASPTVRARCVDQRVRCDFESARVASLAARSTSLRSVRRRCHASRLQSTRVTQSARRLHPQSDPHRSPVRRSPQVVLAAVQLAAPPSIAPAADSGRRRAAVAASSHGSAVSISVSHRSSGAVAGSTNGIGSLVGVEQHQQRVADDALAALVDFVDRVAVEPHAEAAHVGRVPGLVASSRARTASSQAMSCTSAPRMRRPWKNLRRRSTGWSFQMRITRRVNSRKSRCSAASGPSCVQLSSLSWQ